MRCMSLRRERLISSVCFNCGGVLLLPIRTCLFAYIRDSSCVMCDTASCLRVKGCCCVGLISCSHIAVFRLLEGPCACGGTGKRAGTKASSSGSVVIRHSKTAMVSARIRPLSQHLSAPYPRTSSPVLRVVGVFPNPAAHFLSSLTTSE